MTAPAEARPRDAATHDAAIEARGVSVRIGPFPIVSDIDLAARPGELVTLVGPNGAGKSTLLHVLAGDLAPTNGAVLLQGAPLRSFARGEVARLRAVLPQQVTVAFPFTVEEVVRMGRAPWRSRPEQERDEEAVATALADAGVAHLATREFPSLSGGERARVAFARLLAQQARVLLLDEPTAALDIRYQELLLQTVRAHATRGGCAVVVIHDLGLAAAYADRIALIAGGALVADGTPHEVLRSDLLSDVYQHEIDVIAHPRSGTPVAVPARATRDERSGSDGGMT